MVQELFTLGNTKLVFSLKWKWVEVEAKLDIKNTGGAKLNLLVQTEAMAYTRSACIVVLMQHAQMLLNRTSWVYLADVFFTSSQQNMALAACTVIDSERSRRVLQKSSVPVNSYESDIFISDSGDLNRFSATAICGSWLSNMAGKQNTAVHPNTTQPRDNWETNPDTCVGKSNLSAWANTSQASGNLFKLKLCFSGAAPGSMTMKFCTYPILT